MSGVGLYSVEVIETLITLDQCRLLAIGSRIDYIRSSSGPLPTRQVQMFDVAIPLVVELVLSAFYI